MSEPSRPVTSVRAVAVRLGRHLEVPEHLATEEPLEIRAAGPGQQPAPVAVTMRTPGDDFELAVGFLRSENLVGPGGVAGVADCPSADPDQRWNTVTVALRQRWTPPVPRRFVTTSACGVCGKASIEEVELDCAPLRPRGVVPASMVATFPDRLRDHQRIFERTGGLHAAGAFGDDGAALVVREDVGRHNAVDKVVGHLALCGRGGRHRVDTTEVALVVSGRVSFEIVQKAALAGFGLLVAVSAPSSLAVQAAQRLGVTVAGFVRGGSFNLYSHPGRIDLDS